MSDYTRYRNIQKSIRENLDNETWKKANEELLKENYVEVIKAESERYQSPSNIDAVINKPYVSQEEQNKKNNAALEEYLKEKGWNSSKDSKWSYIR